MPCRLLTHTRAHTKINWSKIQFCLATSEKENGKLQSGIDLFSKFSALQLQF
jgi:hypothetical protein